MRKTVVIACVLTVAAGLLAGCSGKTETTAAKGEWKPEENIEFICQSSAGGGSDLMARTIAQMMKDEGIINQPVVVENITGSGGCKAFSYTLEKTGSEYNWQTVNSNFFTAPISGNIKQDYRDYSLIAVIGTDPNVLCVPWDSPFQTFEDVVAAAKAEPGKYSISIGGAGSSGACATIMMQDACGIELNQIPFEGGADGLTAVMGGQVDMGWQGVAELIGPWESKLLRPIAVAENNRIEALKDIPTMKELGYDVVFSVPRAIVGPPEMPEAAYNYYVKAFEKLNESEKWQKDYIEANYIIPNTAFGQEACEAVFKNFHNDTWDLYNVMGLAVSEKIE